MFVSNGLNVKLRNDLHMNSAICGFESLFIEVKHNTNLKNMTKLNTELNNANCARVYNELNPNTSYEIFIEILNSHIDECQYTIFY